MTEPMQIQPHELGVIQASNGSANSYKQFKDIAGNWLQIHGLQNRILSGVFQSIWGVNLAGFLNNPADWMKHSTSLRSKSVSDWMRSMGKASAGNDELCEKFNDKLWTHNADGSLNRAVSTDIRRQFEPGNEWPQLFLTSNHALASNHEDLSGIMRGFRKLAQDTFGLPVKLKRTIDQNTVTDASDTLIVSAVHAERNPWFNGAELIDRLNVLRDAVSKTGRAPTDLAHISPAAKRLGKVMLKLLVMQPEQIDVDSSRYAALDMQVTLPLTFRPDAELVAQHIHLMGYSKGGNTVTDAMRYLVQELKHGNPDLTPKDISNVLKHIGLLCVAAGEIPLTEEEKEYGIRRMSVINRHDVIANHFRAGDDDKYTLDDDFYVIDGVGKDFGHNPRDAMGYYEEGQESRTGFLHANSLVHDRLRCYFASCFGKSAITDIIFTPSFDGQGYGIEFEFAPGVSMPSIGDPAFNTLNKAFAGVGLEGFSVICDAKTRRGYATIGDNSVIRDPQQIAEDIIKALHHAQSDNLIISDRVFIELNKWHPTHRVEKVGYEGAAKPEAVSESYVKAG